MRVPIIGSSNKAQTHISSTQKLINLMPEQGASDDVSPVFLGMTPGIKQFGTMGSIVGDRGLYVMNGQLYGVYNDKLYSIDSSGTATALGTVTALNRYIAADNGVQLVIVADNSTYVYDRLAGTLVTLDTVPSFLPASAVAYLDGYFIFSAKDSNQMFSSELLDPITGKVDFTSFNALKRAQAWTAAGDIVHIVANHKELWVYKADSLEVWQNSGSVDFPLSRRSGAYIDQGVVAPRTVVAKYDTILWLGSDYKVRMLQGYSPVVISTPALSREIFEYVTAADAYAQLWDEGDHKLYGIWFPTADVTWVYDLTTREWHQRQSFERGVWRASSVVHVYDKLIVGDSVAAVTGELDFDTFQEYGTMIQAIRVGQTLHSEDKLFSIDRIQVRVETGVGYGTAQGADPQIALFLSSDYGKTYGTQKNRSLGKIGEFKKTVTWRSQGLYRQCTPKLVITDPVRRYIADAYAEISVRRV